MNHKKRFNVLLSFVLVLSMVFASFGNVAMAESQETDIRLVHLNDIHGRANEDDYEGAMGFPILKTKLDQLKKENPNTLVLSAGDTFHGTTEVNLTEGEAMVDVMNMAGFDLMVLGNHDFNFGYERLLELKELSDFPLISANVYEKDSGETQFDPYITYDMDGVKIGIFGLTTTETAIKTHPDNVVNVEFKDEIKAAETSVEALKAKGADLIIGLTHIGIEGTLAATTRDVIEAVDGIDIIIDGHSHEITDEKINDTILVQAGEYTKNIGVLDLKVKDGKLVSYDHNLITYEDVKDLQGDKEILDYLANLEEENKEILDAIVGESKVKLDGQREDVRTRETNLGNLIADIMRDSTEADVAFTNGGGIRADIEEGPVTKGDIITAFPFTNTVAVIEVTGQELLEGLERGVENYPEQAGWFPQVSGITFKFDPKREALDRVWEVHIGEDKLDLEKTYTLATNDFIASGGDGYTSFTGKDFVAEGGGLLSDVFIAYFEKNEVVNPKIEGRIVAETKPVEIIFKGEKVSIDKELGEVYIDVKKDRTMIPVRALFEELGHEVTWDNANRMVKIDDNVSLIIGDKTLNVDGEKIEMDIAAEIKDDRTYMPIRFIAEGLGYTVDFDAENIAVIID